MRAKDVMSSPVYSVRPDVTVESAAEMMTARSVTALPVVDETGALVGMVSESDLLWHRVPPDPTAHLRRDLGAPAGGRPRTVDEVMTGRPRSTWPDADLAEVAGVMLRFDVRSMPVVDDVAGVVGIISRRDILRVVVRGDDVLTGEVQHRLDEYADGQRRWTATVHEGVATVHGDYRNDTERTVVAVLARTVPGVASVRLGEATPS